MKTVYLPETGNTNQIFYSSEACQKYEEEQKLKLEELNKYFAENSSFVKLSKLKDDLDKAASIPIGTIATCSYDSLAVKGMVKICMEFAETNKDYLNYY